MHTGGPPPTSIILQTSRLTLRASRPDDWTRAFEIQSNWRVTRMLRRGVFPPEPDRTRNWFRGHLTEWRSGAAFRFAMLEEGRFVGLIDLDDVTRDRADLGYWLEERCWGRGLATEAARAIVGFASHNLTLRTLYASHAEDNSASSSVLLKLGFRHVSDAPVQSTSRGSKIIQRQYELDLT